MIAHDIYSAHEDLTIPIPYNVVITKAHGTMVASAVLAATTEKPLVYVNFSAEVLTPGATAVAVCLFVDDQNFPTKTSAINVAAGAFCPLSFRLMYEPGDCLPHTYRIHVGAHSGSCKLNGGTLYDNTMSALLTVELKEPA